MLRTMRGLLAFGLLVVALTALAVRAQEEKPVLVDNPKYRMWAGHKPGATAVHVEKTVLAGDEKAAYPGGVDEKVIAYKLLSISPEKAVVQAVVTERDFLRTVESAPTKITFPAKVSKVNLVGGLPEYVVKVADEEETVKVGGKEIKCKVLKGSFKKDDGTVDFKLCFSESVPGGLVSRVRKAKVGDKTFAETITTLRSYGDAPAPKTK